MQFVDALLVLAVLGTGVVYQKHGFKASPFKGDFA